VIVPDVADAGLERERDVDEWLELSDGTRDGAGQSGEELASERGEFGPGGVGDCAG
jgi:hypothetical protein